MRTVVVVGYVLKIVRHRIFRCLTERQLQGISVQCVIGVLVNARKRQLHFWGRKWLISTLSQSMYRQEIRLDVKRVILFSFSDRWLLI